MKKTYFKPTTVMVAVTVSPLMQLSFQMKSDAASVNDSGDYETLSRRGSSLWDDEDCEE